MISSFSSFLRLSLRGVVSGERAVGGVDIDRLYAVVGRPKNATRRRGEAEKRRKTEKGF
jgi:hypothetical protein